ncbi:MAG: hypothetical protein JO286_12715 [Solirubrobacterales bacterium]|nr:hypothetical protein [Solirubrobacterales bacterium]MBV9808044.1 hypothetical protein [Solirubrobacterales bacterium]
MCPSPAVLVRSNLPAGISLDDIEEEPAKVRDWRADDPRFRLDNVVITPQAAYDSEEAIGAVRRFAAEEVVRVLTGQPPLSPVNAGQLVEARWSRSR